MLKEYDIRFEVRFELEYLEGFRKRKTGSSTLDVPFHRSVIAHDAEEVAQALKERFDDYIDEVVRTGRFYPWSQIAGCCDYNPNIGNVTLCSYEIKTDDSFKLTSIDVRRFTAKQAMEKLTIDEIAEVWGENISKILFNPS